MVSPIAPADFEAYEALILSGQVPHEDAPAFLDNDPAFAEWYRERAKTRADSPLATPRS